MPRKLKRKQELEGAPQYYLKPITITAFDNFKNTFFLLVYAVISTKIIDDDIREETRNVIFRVYLRTSSETHSVPN